METGSITVAIGDGRTSGVDEGAGGDGREVDVGTGTEDGSTGGGGGVISSM